jgi:hypothetical protein
LLILPLPTTRSTLHRTELRTLCFDFFLPSFRHQHHEKYFCSLGNWMNDD